MAEEANSNAERESELPDVQMSLLSPEGYK